MKTSTSYAQATPSLALLKYWGKHNPKKNIPATTSIAINLSDELHTYARVSFSSQDTVVIQEKNQDMRRYKNFLHAIRTRIRSSHKYKIVFSGTVPFASGLAGSSSAFAALTAAIANLEQHHCSTRDLSSLARWGSVSASRAVLGGFTRFQAKKDYAEQLFPADYWKELRIIINITSYQEKHLSSRDAMIRTKNTSTYYPTWLRTARSFEKDFYHALKRKDIEAVGEFMRYSYLHMFATMLTSTPPILYWNSTSIALLHAATTMRKAGIPIWETMDAGPHVKFITLTQSVPDVLAHTRIIKGVLKSIVSTIGEGVRIIS